VSLALGDVVPHIIIQSLRLRVGKFESHLAKDFCNNIGPTQTWRDVRLESAVRAKADVNHESDAAVGPFAHKPITPCHRYPTRDSLVRGLMVLWCYGLIGSSVASFGAVTSTVLPRVRRFHALKVARKLQSQISDLGHARVPGIRPGRGWGPVQHTRRGPWWCSSQRRMKRI